MLDLISRKTKEFCNYCGSLTENELVRVKLDIDRTGFGGYDGRQSQKTQTKWVEMIQILVKKVVGARDTMCWMLNKFTESGKCGEDLVEFTWGIFYLNHRLDI